MILFQDKSKLRYIYFTCFTLLFFSNAFLETHEIIIIYTSNTSGKLTNCKCPSDSLWGLDKRITVLDSLCRQYPNAIVLDSGDLFTEKDELYFKNPYVIDFYNLMKYTAITPGDQEFSKGVGFAYNMLFNKLKDGKDIVIAANLEIDNAESQFKPYRIINLDKDCKIGIIGIISPKVFKYAPMDWKKDIEINNPFNVLRSLIPKLKKECNLIILLSHSGMDNDKELAVKFPEIEVIVGGHNQELINEPKRWGKNKNGAFILQAGPNGSYVGIFKANVNNGKIIEHSNEIIPLTNSFHTSQDALTILKKYNEESSEIAEYYAENIRKEKEELAKKPGVITLRFFFTLDCSACEKIKLDDLPWDMLD